MSYEHLQLEVRRHVGLLWLNRPAKRNALSADMWADLPRAVGELDADPEVRVVLVAGRGPAFTVGIDLELLSSLGHPDGSSPATRRMAAYRTVKELQSTCDALERCSKPVIAAVHGYCLGAGVDLITACDMRIAAADAVFSVRETRLAIVADVGTLQRLPRIIAPGHVAELAFTGKDVDAARALEIGLVEHVHPDRESLLEGGLDLAGEIAANSPFVVAGVKRVLRAGAGRSVEDALDHVALWNAAFLDTNDLTEAMTAFFEKRPPRFTGT